MSLQYGISTLKVNHRNTRKRCKKCSKLTTKNTRATSTGVFIDIDNFEHVNAGWVRSSMIITLTQHVDTLFIIINTSAIVEGQLSRGELYRGNCLRGKSLGVIALGGIS